MKYATKYISIDIETTGLNVQSDQILEVAAVLWEPDGNDVMKFPYYQRYVKWDVLRGSPRALTMNAKIIEMMANLGNSHLGDGWVRIGNLGPSFKNWLLNHGIQDSRGLHVIGKNVSGFDLRFLEKVPNFPEFSHRCLDVGALYAGTQGVPSTDELLARYPLPGIPGKGHEALYDARVALALAMKRLGALST
jgi:DNA polymerase III epsilon subunit-like protein